MSDFVTRFAPSPTGLLHLGHAFSARVAYEAVQNAGGRFLLRIEDIDTIRCKPGFEKAIVEDLNWLGLTWESAVRRQSDHFDDYENALNKLRDKNVVYRCFKTRKEIADDIARAPHLSPDGPEGPKYVGEKLDVDEEQSRLDKGDPFAWRLSMKASQALLKEQFTDLSFVEVGAGPKGETGRVNATPEIFGDPVIARKDLGTSYHLASVFDDALQGITHVIRGADLFPATHLHRLLQTLLDLPEPTYYHHPLILDDNGKRFSKRDQSVTLSALRADGVTVAEIHSMLDALSR